MARRNRGGLTGEIRSVAFAGVTVYRAAARQMMELIAGRTKVMAREKPAEVAEKATEKELLHGVIRELQIMNRNLSRFLPILALNTVLCADELASMGFVTRQGDADTAPDLGDLPGAEPPQAEAPTAGAAASQDIPF